MKQYYYYHPISVWGKCLGHLRWVSSGGWFKPGQSASGIHASNHYAHLTKIDMQWILVNSWRWRVDIIMGMTCVKSPQFTSTAALLEFWTPLLGFSINFECMATPHLFYPRPFLSTISKFPSPLKAQLSWSSMKHSLRPSSLLPDSLLCTFLV